MWEIWNDLRKAAVYIAARCDTCGTKKHASVFVKDEKHTLKLYVLPTSPHFVPLGEGRVGICGVFAFWIKYGNALQDGVRGGGGLL